MKHLKIGLTTLITIIFFTSCSNDDSTTISLGNYEHGIFVVNEGSFNGGNASISYASYNFENFENKVFYKANGSILGDTAQSIGFYNDLAFIVVNNSQKIEIINRYTFKSIATVNTGLLNPRYIAFANGKGYVTNWGDGFNLDDDYIAILNLETFSIIDSIAVKEGPEKIITKDNFIYVAHQGGYNQNNIISVINANTNIVDTTITVGDVPNSLKLDNNGTLWVLSGGTPSYTGNETGGSLSKINITTNTVEETLNFNTTEHPRFLQVEGNMLYWYLNGGVYKTNSAALNIPKTPEFSGLNLYNMAIYKNTLYGSNAGDFTGKGTLTAYDLSTNSETASITVGIIPGNIYFQ